MYDNVESHHILNDCWPNASHGAILVTTRNHTVASLPIDRGLEIKEFSVEDGAAFLLYLLPPRQFSKLEKEAASELAALLHGYALAISQMAAYIAARSILIKDFLALYKKYPQRLHREKKPGWKYLGYKHAVDTVWDISFEALNQTSMFCITIMSFLSADAIPDSLFKVDEPITVLEQLSFCQDELAWVSHVDL